MAFLADALSRVKPSATIAVSQKARDLKAKGRDVIGLGAGEPDFDTPDNIKAAAIAAIQRGETKYTDVDGLPELKAAVAAKFARENGLTYGTDQIHVAPGGKAVIYNALVATLSPGDEVIVPAPYWVSYPDMVLLAGGEPVVVIGHEADGFKLKPEALEAAITPKTKWLILNSPSNPTGAVYTADELAALGAVLRKHPQVLIASDDMYEHIRLDGAPFVNILNACPDLYDRTLVLNGVSKAYSMTGWRIGYAAGPEAILRAMTKVQSQSTSNPTSISQVAAEAALNGDQGCITPMLDAFKTRHRYVVDALNAIPGFKCVDSGGAFYAFPDVRAAIQNLLSRDVIEQGTDIAFSEYLLESADVAVVPGSAFGAEGYIRLSFATSQANLEKALKRIAAALA